MAAPSFSLIPQGNPFDPTSMLAFSRKIAPDLCLETLQEEDAAPLFAIVDANRGHLRPWMTWVDTTCSPEDVRKFIEGSLAQAANRLGFSAVIRWEGRIAGIAGFHTIDWNNFSATMGYWLAEDCQGHGIMTRCAQALVDFAFAALNLNRVTIACAVDNQRSRAIPERLGLTQEGVLRDAERLESRYVDHAIYSILQREWQRNLLCSAGQTKAE